VADPRAYDTPVEVERGEALALLGGLIEGVPDAQVTFAEAFGNPHLIGSPATLLEAARIDHGVRAEHGLSLLVGALARVVAYQDARIAELEEAAAKPRTRSAARK
jgi:hypothetical protein